MIRVPVLTGAGSRLPWNAAHDAPWAKPSCRVKNGVIQRNDPINCTMPQLSQHGILCEGATISGNTFVWGQDKKLLHVHRVVQPRGPRDRTLPRAERLTPPAHRHKHYPPHVASLLANPAEMYQPSCVIYHLSSR